MKNTNKKEKLTPRQKDFAERVAKLDEYLKEVNLKIACKQVLKPDGVIELEAWYVDTKPKE